jgi:hypothetical protein
MHNQKKKAVQGNSPEAVKSAPQVLVNATSHWSRPLRRVNQISAL